MQLLKWLFAILVLLNVIVFANVVTQKMNGNRPQSNPAVVAVPVGTAGNVAPESNTSVSPTQAGSSMGARMAPIAPIRRENNQGNVAQAPVAMPKNSPNCSAQITLPEDAYHRLKTFIGSWSNSASRQVVENKQAQKKRAMQYQVLVAAAGDDTLQQLREAGLNASSQGGNISLGIFANAEQAYAVRSRAIGAGVGGVVVSERGGEQAALTTAQYTVTFFNVTQQDVNKINEVLGRYGRLQRSACGN